MGVSLAYCVKSWDERRDTINKRLRHCTASAATLALKRLLDVAGSSLGLITLWPLFIIIAVAIKLETPGLVFFRQERVGRGGKLFHILKFRSMVCDAPQIGRVITIRSDSRITRVGSFIRKIKLDEFPQLINVLIGHMSLVGPRPEVPELMTLYTQEQQALILSFRPGMTDYASILFRHESYLLDGRDDPVEVYRREIMPIQVLVL
jgi:lipopolysaccharide/colanic/teichoic acid biosynthesis glycosyltransferase